MYRQVLNHHRNGPLWPGLVVLGLSGALVGCGADEPPPARQVSQETYQGMPQQPAPGYQQPYAPPAMPQQQWGVPSQQAPMPQQQWGVPSQQAPMPRQAWQQQMPFPSAQGQAPTMSYPPADNPWQKPPTAFGGAVQGPQIMWQQPAPAMPQFRPLEQDKGSEYRSAEVPAVAPYDLPIGSSQDQRRQPGWPGYAPGGAGYPGYPGYPAYPGMQPGYWGAPPGPWGMPGAAGAWPMW